QTYRALWGMCDALFTPRPLGPLYDIASQMGGELAALLQGEIDRTALFAACLQALQTPGIVLFEDIHWADEATLDLLKFLGRRIQRTRTLLIATYRDDEVGPQHPLRLLLGDLASNAARLHIELTPLSVQAVSRLVGERPYDAALLQKQTGGNPFFVTEALAAEGEGIPATVRDVVLARTARLSAAGQAALPAAAVIGAIIEPWLLNQLVQEDAAAVTESLHLGILQAHGDLLAFRHDLVRQTILDATPPHQRVLLHQSVLAALQETAVAQNDPARLTHHAKAANDPQAILKYAPIAGKEAAALGMNRAAAALFALALAHAASLPLLQQIELYEAYALSAQVGPDKTKAIEAYRRAVALARQGNLPEREGYHLARLAGLLEVSGERVESSRLLDEALTILEPLPPSRGLVLAYMRRALQRFRQGRVEEARALTEKGHHLALKLEEMYFILGSCRLSGLCNLSLDYRRGCELLEKCLAQALAQDEFWIAGMLYPDLVTVYVDVYRFDRAAELIAAGVAFAAEHDMDLARDTMLAGQAAIHFYHGRWPEAATLINELQQRDVLHPYAAAPAKVTLGRLLARQGKPGAAAALAEALGEMDEWRFSSAYSARAEAAWLAGDPDGALAEARAGYALAARNRQPGFAAELAYWRWRAGDGVETYDWMIRPYRLEMQGNWREAAAAWAALGCPYEQARALADGDSDAQLTALAIFERLGARPMADLLRQKLREAGLAAIPRGPRSATKKNPFQLTNRQLEILRLLTENLTNAEIAARLHISPKTVDHHVSAVLGKLNVSSRAEAAAIARQRPDL
ncbi:MAG TPA: helix-turn-helix transcriptional regulator, partial [Anaerolineae bacterium]|nr:helix-turn-helix transcriptional regulator [Anaerolineae bacterium]